MCLCGIGGPVMVGCVDVGGGVCVMVKFVW